MFDSVSYIIGHKAGKGKSVEIEIVGGVTCTDDGDGNVTVTDDGE